MDDLVEQIRQAFDGSVYSGPSPESKKELALKAANEIEQLRKLLHARVQIPVSEHTDEDREWATQTASAVVALDAAEARCARSQAVVEAARAAALCLKVVRKISFNTRNPDDIEMLHEMASDADAFLDTALAAIDAEGEKG